MTEFQLPSLATFINSEVSDSNREITCGFIGTDNPRHLRVLHALAIRPCKREEIDRIAGASNGPDLISALRQRGLAIPCEMVPSIDRDGLRIKYGVYSLTDNDRIKLKIWSRKGGPK